MKIKQFIDPQSLLEIIAEFENGEQFYISVETLDTDAKEVLQALIKSKFLTPVSSNLVDPEPILSRACYMKTSEFQRPMEVN